MGITLKTVSVKWDAETIRMSDELQATFAPFIEGRSQLTRLAVKKLYSDVLTHGTLAVIAECLQGFPSLSSSPQPTIQFPAYPEVGKHHEFEALLQQATVPTSLFPKFGLKARVQ